MIANGVNNPSRGLEPRTDGVSCTIKAGESGTKNLIQIAEGKQGKRVYSDEGVHPALAAPATGGVANNFIQVGTLRTHKDGEGFREMKEDVSPALNARARQDGSQQPIIAIPVLTPDRAEKRQNGRRFKEQGEARFTLTAQDQHGVFTGKRIRRLTPTECERLQGFPDGWTKYGLFFERPTRKDLLWREQQPELWAYGTRMYKEGDVTLRELSDTQRYKMLGNAVTTNVIQTIVSEMLAEGCLQ